MHPLRGITCVFLKADFSESEPGGLYLSTHRSILLLKAFFSPSGVLDRGLGLWRVAANRRRVAGLSLRWPLLVATPLQRTDRGGRLSVGCSQTKNRTAGPYVARRTPEPRDSPGKAFLPFAFFFFFFYFLVSLNISWFPVESFWRKVFCEAQASADKCRRVKWR